MKSATRAAELRSLTGTVHLDFERNRPSRGRGDTFTAVKRKNFLQKSREYENVVNALFFTHKWWNGMVSAIAQARVMLHSSAHVPLFYFRPHLRRSWIRHI